MTQSYWKALALAGALLASAGGPASAGGSLKDDYVAPPFSWTGMYMGVHVGGAWAKSSIADLDAYAAAATPGTVTTDKTTDIFGGAQIGYNLQSGALVYGIEADLGYMGLNHDSLLTGTASGSRVGIDSGWYGDITGRLGVATGRSLFYVKGGWAFYNGTEKFSTVSGSFSRKDDTGVFTGWTLGAGAEFMLDAKWSMKLEYQHFDFGTESFTVYNAGGTPFRFDHDLTVDTVKVGLNYKF